MAKVAELPTIGHRPVANSDRNGAELGGTVYEEVSEKPMRGSPDLPRRPYAQNNVHPVQVAPDTMRLRDIAEASFGEIHAGRHPESVVPVIYDGEVTESVINADDRIEVADPSDHPWRMNASLRITAADNSLWLGTGWFIGARTLVTAGHCVFIHAPGSSRHGWVRSIQVMPGRNGSALPYGSVTATDFRTVESWTQSPDPDYDYGAVIIPTELGNTVGAYGFGIYPDSELLASTVYVSGYPGDKPSGTQWYHDRRVTSVKPLKVYYDIDTAGGQSGSAVYRIIDGEYYAAAIHAYGGATENSGTRITQDVYDNLVAWKA
jgi:V8-like Glu-specific endopeptidase